MFMIAKLQELTGHIIFDSGSKDAQVVVTLVHKPRTPLSGFGQIHMPTDCSCEAFESLPGSLVIIVFMHAVF